MKVPPPFHRLFTFKPREASLFLGFAQRSSLSAVKGRDVFFGRKNRKETFAQVPL
jgi:hypothetical protein